MTVAVILLFRRIKSGGGFYQKIILPLSKAGYGMYLIHMIFLSFYSGWLRDGLGIGAQGILGIWTTPVQILLTAVLSFVSTALAAVLLQRIPRLGRYLIG